MIRLHFVVEGQTEEEFVNSMLVSHLSAVNIFGDVRCVETSRHHLKIYRGGGTTYEKMKKDLILWMKEDRQSDAFFTTMFDVYGLPSDFPGIESARKQTDPYQRVALLERALADDMAHRRFVPYLQLHEFEALILSDPTKFDVRFIEHQKGIQALIVECSSYQSPELIDDNETTAPSKRIIAKIPDYEGSKHSAGPLIAKQIGLTAIRQKCSHFDSWLTKLETLPRDQS
jgi:hypothetical protein